MAKERLDNLLMARGLAASREQAKRRIMAGEVYVNGQKEDKAGSAFPEDALIEWRGDPLPYVSRGGLKLKKAIDTFGLDLSGLTCMDIGASTGGFTDCMLQEGAVKVFAVDVGHGQLDWSLRTDERVVCMEKTNARYLTSEQLGGARPDFSSIDVSFISLSRILPAVKLCLNDGGRIVCLIKPQFEAGREKVGKKGVVRDPEVHREVIENVLAFCGENELYPLGLTYSPVKGPEGNIEYLLYLSKDRPAEVFIPDPAGTVEAAHAALD
ncbi:MAG: TlyA family RNA methyltransferase [Lachnospiraceae bacterium]|nr:TlyA family RNA methyltransferase [Lachnospiraceae bacterium]